MNSGTALLVATISFLLIGYLEVLLHEAAHARALQRNLDKEIAIRVGFCAREVRSDFLLQKILRVRAAPTVRLFVGLPWFGGYTGRYVAAMCSLPSAREVAIDVYSAAYRADIARGFWSLALGLPATLVVRIIFGDAAGAYVLLMTILAAFVFIGSGLANQYWYKLKPRPNDGPVTDGQAVNRLREGLEFTDRGLRPQMLAAIARSPRRATWFAKRMELGNIP